MIFLTVGTQFPFDRLVRSIDDACQKGLIDDEVFAQIGDSSYCPRNFEYKKTLDKDTFDRQLRSASAVISHAGMGTITMAMENNKPLLVLPRSPEYGEVVNDHQFGIARNFEKNNHVLVAFSEDQLAEKIQKLETFVPAPRLSQASVVTKTISDFINALQ
jgi:beta-1,4-N-acetylglucosaminyltransferase